MVICAILAIDNGRIAGPPSPPYETLPSTLTSNSSEPGSIGGSDVNVFDDEIASAPALNAASASFAMLVVVGVSFTQTGRFATSFTARTTESIS